MTTIAYLSLGSNSGDSFKLIDQAVSLINLAENMSIVATSALYETEPWGVKDQNWFLNLAIQIKTDLSAEDLLVKKNVKEEHREVLLEELKDFAECGLCGTAAVISPVGKIDDHGTPICFPSGMDEMGPTTKKLYETLTGIQMGKIKAPEGWIRVII